MAKPRVGISGFGRIGRILFRAGFQDLDIVGINDTASVSEMAHLLKWDSNHGKFEGTVEHDEKNLIVNGKKIPTVSTRKPEEIPWKEWGVDIVLECTGAFKKKEDFLKHIQGGAKKVLVSAPAEGADLTVVYGVNHTGYDAKSHVVVSNASCTTNCLAPIAKILHEKFEIERGFMMTIHSYTNDQRILDGSHKDLRRARAAAVSMIPTTTGAAKAVGQVLPALKGKLDGTSMRVPTPNVSVVDFTATVKKDITRETINDALTAAANGPLRGVLGVEKEPLVSVDYMSNPLSSIVDLESTMVLDGKMFKVLSWYDNEMGFSHRMVDFAKYMAEKGL